jgi:hypothetical protein
MHYTTTCHPLCGSVCPPHRQRAVSSCRHPLCMPCHLPMTPAKRCQSAGSTCDHLTTDTAPTSYIDSRAAHVEPQLLTIIPSWRPRGGGASGGSAATSKSHCT